MGVSLLCVIGRERGWTLEPLTGSLTLGSAHNAFTCEMGMVIVSTQQGFAVVPTVFVKQDLGRVHDCCAYSFVKMPLGRGDPGVRG